jgi:CelD/BcsL family acetyltransferase involved in cellulose biosynthesis
MKVSLCTPDELGPAEIHTWRKLQWCDDRLASPFLAPEFALVLGRHRDDVRVAVIEDGPSVVGFFAHQRGRLGVGRALGYGLSNLQGVVHAPGLEWQPRDLLAQCGLAVWEFDHLVVDQLKAFGPRHAALAPAPFIDLSPGWDEWLRAKRAASSTVKKVQQNRRKLGREAGEVTFEFDSRRRDGLQLLMQWKSAQYRRKGRFDRFAKPWFVATFEELTEMATADFSGVLSVLSVDGRPIAMQQALRANGTLACWFPAYDVRFRAYSPGLACMLDLLQAAAERGLLQVDLAKGYADYKETLKDSEHTVVEGWVERPSPVATLRRVQQAPRRHVVDYVRAQPRLRQVARKALNDVGRLRTTLRHREEEDEFSNR